MTGNRLRVELPRVEAACLEALRSGARSKSRAAVAAGVTLKAADRALRRLAEKGLAGVMAARPGGATRWEPTGLGEHATITTVETRRRRGRPPEPAARPGSSTERLLQRLDRPKRVAELAMELGVTRQRVHQIVVRLLAHGLVRLADPEQPSRIVARSDDPTILLRGDEERVLSAFPDEAVTTTRNLARRVKLPPLKLDEAIGALAAHGMVEKAGEDASHAHFKLTRAGAEHFQRSPSARRADPPILPVKSDRVRSVLDYLAANGPTRTTQVGRDLDIGRESMNALMQYLKRRGLARKAGATPTAPHELTREGLRVRDEMMRRAASARE